MPCWRLGACQIDNNLKVTSVMSETTVVLCSLTKCGMICESRQTVRIQKLARVLDELGRVYVNNWDCIVHLSCFL